MQYAENLCQLVIKNMAIIEEAPNVVQEVEKVLFSVINDQIEKSVSKQDGWKGSYDLVTDKDSECTQFAPSDWPKDESGTDFARYELYCIEPEGSSFEWLSCATGLRNAMLCFQFSIDNSSINISTREKKRLCQDFFARTSALSKSGFMYKKTGEIYIPFAFDAETLANEYPDFDEAKEILDKALKTLFEVHPLFDAFVKGIQK